MAIRECLPRLIELGISLDDAEALRRIAMVFHTWDVMECGGGNRYASWAIERDETGVPYLATYPHEGKSSRRRIPDRERGAQKRLAAILKRYPTLQAYQQTDPRGASLYILRPGDVPPGERVDAYYSRGIAVYK